VNHITEMTVDILAGSRVEEAIAEAIKMAQGNRCVVKFEFNGRPIHVDATSDPEAISKGWWEIGFIDAMLQGAYVQPSGEVKWGSDGR
jgi:hypothetical protein